MKTKYLYISIIVFLLILYSKNLNCCEATTGSACFYVAVDGIDGSDRGGIDKPYKTFAPAIAKALPGDFIYARGGTYGINNSMQTNAGGRAMISLEPESTNSFSASTTEYATIKSFPGEKAILDVSSFAGGSVYINNVHHWKIEGFEITGAMVHIWGGNESEGNSHDIIIENNNIHGVVGDGGTNPGLIKINRGDSGGAYNIFIRGNKLHDLSDIDSPGEWEEDKAVDTAHFGAITTLSACNYYGIDAGCTGFIEISGNEIYEVPNAFFFKNEMYGPIEIKNNYIHHSNGMGMLQSANVHIMNNLVVGLQGGFYPVGDSSFYDDGVKAISGHFAIIKNNTFVGIDGLLGILSGTGHTIEYNVFFGLTGRVAGAQWGTGSYLSKSQFYPDTMDTATSILQDITSDNNCFITPYSDFQFVSRYMPESVTGAEFIIEHYTYEEAKSTFGFDPNSKIIIESDATKIFKDPVYIDYTLLDESICPQMGYDKEAVPISDPEDSIDSDNGNDSDLDIDMNPSGESGNSGLFVSGGCGLTGDLPANKNTKGFSMLLFLIFTVFLFTNRK